MSMTIYRTFTGLPLCGLMAFFSAFDINRIYKKNMVVRKPPHHGASTTYVKPEKQLTGLPNAFMFDFCLLSALLFKGDIATFVDYQSVMNLFRVSGNLFGLLWPDAHSKALCDPVWTNRHYLVVMADSDSSVFIQGAPSATSYTGPNFIHHSGHPSKIRGLLNSGCPSFTASSSGVPASMGRKILNRGMNFNRRRCLRVGRG